ncbi:MAG: hypothetical protein ACK56F_29780, partial [bacterium]
PSALQLHRTLRGGESDHEGEVTAFARCQDYPLSAGKGCLPGGKIEIAQPQHPRPRRMGHHPSQGAAQGFRPQRIEMVGMEFIAGRQGHTAAGHHQPRRGREGKAATPAELLLPRL